MGYSIMARRKSKDEQQSVRGISPSAQAKAIEKAKAVLSSGKNIVDLPVGNGRRVTFEKIMVPWDKIDSVTVVDTENERDQDLLNDYYCDDILPSFKENGQLRPAIAQWRGDKVDVVDGSRRRYSAKRTQKDFEVYVTKELLTGDEVKFLSEIYNVNKKISLYELGKKYRHYLDLERYKDAKELAKAEHVDPATVSIALKAFDKIPMAIAHKIPAIDVFGRPAINTLTNILESLGGTDYEQVVDGIATMEIAEPESGKVTGKAMNKLFMEQVQALVPKKKVKSQRKHKVLASNGKQRVSLSGETKSGFNLNFSGIDKTKRTLILETIENVIKQ